MSWADIKRKYETVGTATQSTEYMAARRIFRALGLTERTVPAAEHELGIVRDNDTTLLERATMLVSAMLPDVRLPPVRDVRSFKEAEDALIELAESPANTVSGKIRLTSLVYRIKGAQDIRALLYLGYAACTMLDLSTVPTPGVLMRTRDGEELLLDCDAIILYTKIIKDRRDCG